MSADTLQKFYATAFKERSLGEAIQAAGTLKQDDFHKIIVELGRAHGCNFTGKEVDTFLGEKTAAAKAGQLDDQMLELVSGGKGAMDVVSDISTMGLSAVARAIGV
ncbi:MAG: Nif11-like leader peptide family natural product precursor [Pseudomonadota bacterium]